MSRACRAEDYTVFAIPQPVNTADVARYRELRLSALQRDPACFSSTYAREAGYTDTDWVARLSADAEMRTTFIVARANEWVGMATVAGAAGVPAFVEMPCERAGTYLVVGMWVRPEDRRKGLGRKLIEAAVQWAEQCAAGHEGEEARVVLAVAEENTAGRALYAAAGFGEEEGTRAGTVWLRRGVTGSVDQRE